MAIATSSRTTIQTSTKTTSVAEELRSRIAGEVLTPADAAYEDARQVQILNYNRRPAAIVRATSTVDVANAVRFARERGLELAVRSGGHSIPGYSMADGVVTIDLSGMKAVTVDPVTKAARVQAGATSGDVAGPAHEHGLAISTGDTSSVGMGGLVTGGGIGLMARKYGLTIDNLISATVVTADGEIVTASSTEHADLFWAIRGGGGNFGIVTEFELQMAEVDQVLGGVILVPATREVIRGFLDYTPTAPEGLTVLMNVMHAPPAPFVPEDRIGDLVVMFFVTWTGEMDEGEQAIAPLRALAEPIVDTIAPIPYPEIYNYTAELTERHGVVVRQMFADSFSDEAIDAVLEAMGRATSPMSLAHFRGQGGAIANVASDATAFAHRTQKYFVAAIAVWPDASDATPHEAWTEGLWQRIRPEGNGVYVNFLANEGEERIGEAYPEATMRRLREVKTAYDPQNMFRYNQNIRPLGSR